jgi:hypothetical protein
MKNSCLPAWVFLYHDYDYKFRRIPEAKGHDGTSMYIKVNMIYISLTLSNDVYNYPKPGGNCEHRCTLMYTMVNMINIPSHIQRCT